MLVHPAKTVNILLKRLDYPNRNQIVDGFYDIIMLFFKSLNTFLDFFDLSLLSTEP